MLILLLPMTTICVALVGFYVWHRQLIRKRHFEVADAALSAFSHAEAAVTYARNPESLAGEGATRKRDNTELPAQSELLGRLFIPYGHMWNGPRDKSFFRRFSRGRGAVICPAFLRGHRPLASMKSAMQVADQKIAL
jgi:hypothetical protein